MATRALAFAAILGLAACSHAAGPSHTNANGVSVSPQHQKQAVAQVRTGVRAYGHHAYKTALTSFDRALKLDPNNVEARFDRGLTEEKIGAFGRASADLRKVASARPDWSAARLHLAAAEFHARNYAAASRDFDVALKGAKGGWRVWLDDGVAYYKMHRYAQARERFAKALALAPKSGRAHFWLGMTYTHLHNKGKAHAELALAAHSRDTLVRNAARHQLKGG